MLVSCESLIAAQSSVAFRAPLSAGDARREYSCENVKENRMTNVHERLPGAMQQINVPPLDDFGAGLAISGAAGTPYARTQTDRILQFTPPSLANGGQGPMGIVQQLLAAIQQMLGSMGLTHFQTASASSTGDPHLAFDGTAADGSSQQTRFDSMTGHHDLLDSDSFAGGYRIATQTTAPGANGVTFNRSARVSTQFGAAQVSLDKDGNATIREDGAQYALSAGQSYDLGNGETVSRNNDGSVIVTDDNGMGGHLTTTLSENGQGVDVRVQAQNVDLGGDLLRTSPHTGAPRRFPPRVRMLSPQLAPWRQKPEASETAQRVRSQTVPD